jgi:serine/threonine protein kinase
MGVVFKAFDSRAGLTVAIKMIGGGAEIAARLGAARSRFTPPAFDRHWRIALIKEARAVSELRHPNIIQVLDYGQHRGLLFVVMEYLEGRSLDAMIKGPAEIPLDAKLGIIIQVCDALAYAHSRGLIHRDVKPSNILVLPEQRVKLLDFGLAAPIAALPAMRVAMGTPLYMAPEAFLNARFDARMDIWAAGVTLYQLLTGRLPFGERFDDGLLGRILNGPVPPLDSSIPHALELDAILRRALAKNPDQRYASAEAFSADLRSLRVSAPSQHEHPLQAAEDSGAGFIPVPSRNRQQNAKLHFDIKLANRGDAVSIRSGRCNARQARARLLSKPSLYHFFFPLLSIAELFSRTGLRVQAQLPLIVASLFLNFAGFIALYPMGESLGQAWGSTQVFYADGQWVQIQERAPYPVEIVVTLDILACVVIAAYGCGLAALALAENLSDIPRCQSCKNWMKHRSEWARYVRNDAAASLGQVDCIMALRYGLWEDAAKLLFVHGKKNAPLYSAALVSTPMRLQLAFFDCEVCSDQAARLITQDKDGLAWTTRPEYLEAYRAQPSIRATRRLSAGRARNTALAVARAASVAFRSRQMDSREFKFISVTLIPFLVLVLFYLNKHNARPGPLVVDHGRVTRPAVTPFDPNQSR